MSAHAMNANASPAPAKTVLLVDDEPNVRLVFKTALEPTGYTLATAESGETRPGLAREIARRPRIAGPPDARPRRHGGLETASRTAARTSPS